MKIQSMRNFSPIALLFLMLSACSFDGKEDSGKEEKILGWRSTGLEFPDAEQTGGVQRLTHIGDDLFALDAYAPEHGAYVIQDTIARPYLWKIWHGRVGSNTWDTLPMPNDNIPHRFVAFGGDLYVGTKYTGEVWKYNLKSGEWSSIAIPALPDGPGSKYYVNVGLFKGELFLGVTSYKSNKHYCWTGGVQDLVGTLVPCPGRLKNLPPEEVQEFNGDLYGILRQFGIFRYSTGDTAWTRLPSPRGLVWVDNDPSQQIEEQVSAIGIHEDKLYFGYKDEHGLYRMESDGSYTSMTPLGAGSHKLRDTQTEIHSILSYQGRLFFSGIGGSTPVLYVPQDSTTPKFGDWKILGEGWCRDSYGCGSQSWGMVGIGDTLYASAWGFLAKVPMNQLDSITRTFYPNLPDSLKPTGN